MNNELILPAQVWVGKPAAVEAAVCHFLQEQYCKVACGSCAVCRQIAARSYHNICWIVPEKNQYSKAECEIIAQKSSFMLEADEHFFFIITAAELLTVAAANSLLKVVEEPPRGYHFIFCAERPRALLPTILSRCVVKTISSEEEQQLVPQLLRFFKEPAHTQMVSFAKTFESVAITEQMTTLLLDELLLFWHRAYRASGYQNYYAQQVMELLTAAYQTVPMPGGAKLFWRNLYLQLLSITEYV